MATREKGYALCVENRGAEDLEIRKVYRVLHDKGAAATGYMRVIDESGEDSRPATCESSTNPVKTTSTRLTISSPSSCRRRRSVPGRRIEASPSDGGLTLGFSGLAPHAAEPARWPARTGGNGS